jgi:hypothetical protein
MFLSGISRKRTSISLCESEGAKVLGGIAFGVLGVGAVASAGAPAIVKVELNAIVSGRTEGPLVKDVDRTWTFGGIILKIAENVSIMFSRFR